MISIQEKIYLINKEIKYKLKTFTDEFEREDLDSFKKLALNAVVFGLIYIVWLFFFVSGPVGWLFFILEFLMYLLVILFAFNHWKRSYFLLGGSYSLRQRVDVVISTRGESLYMLENTIAAANAISFVNKIIYVFDDSNRTEVELLAEKYGARYFVRPDRITRAFKSATLNYFFKNSTGDFILTLDADQVPTSKIVDDLLGYFNDPKVALVATRQEFNVPEADFNHDHAFYGYMQNGKNADNCAISCGSGVIYRRSALDEIGGFQEWNLVEDLYTSYVFNTRGYKTLYVAQAYSKGDAPLELRVIYKQRGTWAFDTLRLFFWKLPYLIKSKLTPRQFLHYFEMGYIYIVSGIIIPCIYLINIYSLGTNISIFHITFWYLIFKIPAFYFTQKLYNELGQGHDSNRMWTSLFPLFFWATIKALFYNKPKTYTVTKKGTKPVLSPLLILPQSIIIILGVVVSFYHIITFGFNFLLTVNVFWLFVMIYWLYPVFPRAFGYYTQYENKRTL